MATHVSTITHTHPVAQAHPFAHETSLPRIRLPRMRTLLTVAFILGGLSIPGLMFFEFIPVNFFWVFIGLALTAVGGVMAMIFYGEL